MLSRGITPTSQCPTQSLGRKETSRKASEGAILVHRNIPELHSSFS